MKLRNYQDEAVNNILDNMANGKKLRVEIPVGLGRSAIIITIAIKSIKKGMKVLILSPNRSTCYQFKDLCYKEDRTIECVSLFEQYAESGLLITTYKEFQSQDQGMNFDLIICDGIQWGNINGKFNREYERGQVCFVGFSSGVGKEVTGFFKDSTCVFQYSIQKAIEAGYFVKGYEFESIVLKIFKNSGYEVSLLEESKYEEWDLNADKQGEHLALVVKFWSSKQLGTNELLKIIGKLNVSVKSSEKRPVLVTNSVVDDEQRQIIKENGFTIVIIDAQNLLYMSRGNIVLENELRSFLSYTTDELLPLKPELEFKTAEYIDDSKQVDELIQKFLDWNPSISKFTEYEELCYEALVYLFKDELTLWEKQKTSNGGLFRYDLICKIKESDIEHEFQKDFWRIAERFFSTKYIIFEFKNYSENITQKEIFTTEKYLYKKALRGIAVIISVYGADENADKAIRGILRENGKIIISLSNNEIIDMLEKKKHNEDATRYLSEKLDSLLIDLEK